ncbi:MAG: Gfo/Idh/MocA family oxidoreductase [Chloroflexi bacterium]|nr:Gfo/Idh/MocA family oxidoreductase [Chloroflexota bacterium]
MMAERLRVAFVGTGNVVRRNHAPEFARIPEVEIVGMQNRTPEKARTLAAEYGCLAFETLDELIQETRPDVVDVGTTERDRFEPVMACLRAGVHVFTEKPLYAARGQFRVEPSDVPHAAEMVNLAAERGRWLGLNFNYRFAPHVGRLKALLDEGRLGEIVSCNVWASLLCWSHVLDLMRYFAGEVAWVSAAERGPIDFRGANAPDRAATLQFASGALGTVIGTSRFAWAHPLLRIEVGGTRGRAAIEDLAGETRFFNYDTGEVTVWAPAADQPRLGFQVSFGRSISTFVRAVRAGEAPPVTGLDGLRELQIEGAIVRSSLERRAVPPY